jgi:hypothetical protein
LLQRLVELVFLVAFLIGALFVFRSSSERSDLTREHQRLMLKTGKLKVTDPTLVHIQAIDTGEPLHFAWRVYLPANYDFAYRCSSGGGSGSGSESWEGIFRVRLKEVNGDYRIYYRFVGGSGLRSLGSRKLKELFNEYPDLRNRLVVEQLGADGLVTYEPSEVKTLIRISMPEDILQPLKGNVNDWEYQRLEQIEWMRIGTRAAIENDPVKINP